ncbi:hypothetical protein CH379_004360 [Leptospira ellisii]|uniref:Uncharacterized protein n=1 Tax=Leptospira ellisii TaxID=2023197 RepID=A0AAE4TXV3_9LEPT|nr:hypothetical protein [Leptospira ellisii]MDV6234862.1 hypothetical protein [Leptospira ellisii]
MEISSLSPNFGFSADDTASVRNSPGIQTPDAGTSEKIEGIVTANPPDPSVSTGRMLDAQA